MADYAAMSVDERTAAFAAYDAAHPETTEG